MFDTYLVLTGAVIILAMMVGYDRTRDPLHPVVILGPLFLYSYVYRPAMLQWADLIGRYLTPEQLDFVGLLNLGGCALFFLGCLVAARQRGPGTFLDWRASLSSEGRRAVLSVAIVLGSIGVLGYAITIVNVGGFVEAYDNAKGGGVAGSGYVGESSLLTIPALAFLLLLWHGKPITLERAFLLALFAAPQLAQGLLGTRRGPMFIVLATLFFGRYLPSRRRPNLLKTLLAVGAIGVIVLFLFANRRQIYLGSEAEISTGRLVESLVPQETTEGHEYVHGAGLVVASDYNGFHHWGARYLTIFLVRPIPKQIWPTKYHDVGMGWMAGEGFLGGLDAYQWYFALGWFPLAGASAGMIADFFLEFSWFGLVGCLAFGWLYGHLWTRAVRLRGLWSVIYVYAAALAIYAPTQSFSAWMHRFLIMTAATAMLWKQLVDWRIRRARVVARPALSAPYVRSFE